MRVILGGIPYNERGMAALDAGSVRYKGTTSDPVPTCNLDLIDNNSSITIPDLAELIILDENVTPNPTQNFLQGPSLKSTDSARWVQSSSAGFAGTTTFSGAPPVTMTITGGSGSSYGEFYQITQVNMIVPGVQYMLSGYLNITSPMSNSSAYLTFSFLDAAGNILDSIGAGNFTTTAGQIRINTDPTLGVAPAGSAYAKVHFGVQQTGGSPTGTAYFSTLQLEPMWFPSIVSYPSPDCNPAQSNCVVLPNNTTVRQYRKFGGLVVNAVADNYHGNVRTWHITANGYAWLLSGIYTISSFTNQADSAIIASLLQQYFPISASGNYLYNTNDVVQGNTIDNLQPNWDDLRSIFNSFAAQAGFYWTVDNYWNVVYQPPGYTQMPISLIADNSANPDNVTTFPIYNWKAERDLTQLGASSLVLGSTATTYLLTALTSGTPVTTLDVAAMPVVVLSGTAMYISGAQGIILSSQANAGDTTLHINSFNPNKNYGVGASITTNPYVGLVIDVANTNIYNQAIWNFGVPGSIFMRKVNDSSLQSVADTTNRGIAECLQYSPARQIYHGMTNVELLVGQGIQVTSNTDGLNAQTLLIQTVTAQWLGVDETLNDKWEYQFDMGAVNRTASSILSHIFRQTTKNTSAPAINSTALLALERFSVFDLPQYPYPTAVLSDGPVAYYRLGEASGGTAYDSSGNNYLGTINGSGVTYGATGAILNDPDGAMTLDGAAGYIHGPAGASVGSFAALTMEAWINLANVAFGTTPRILSCDDTGSTHNGVDFFFQANGAGITLIIGAGGIITTLSASYQFSAGKYYHIAATWSNSTNLLLYINGVQVASGSRSGTIGTPAQNMTIGKNPATGTNFLPGTVDEVAWYQAQLSAARILKHYNVGITGKA